MVFVYNKIVQELIDYVKEYDIKSLILGISGGIDSTVCAALCRKVCDKVGIPLVGRSLPINNKEDEFSVSKLVGEAFCNDFKVVNLQGVYIETLDRIVCAEEANFDPQSDLSWHNSHNQTPIANGNIQARLRMIYLYNLASIHKGIVIDTDNKTENLLGFFTLHGDQGDYKPLIGLWKTDVYDLAKWLIAEYRIKKETNRYNALLESVRLTPTDGLGISSSDLEQIGAESYSDVDDILKHLTTCTMTFDKFIVKLQELEFKYGSEVVTSVISRYSKSKFKRVPNTPGTYYFD